MEHFGRSKRVANPSLTSVESCCISRVKPDGELGSLFLPDNNTFYKIVKQLFKMQISKSFKFSIHKIYALAKGF